MRFKWKSVIKTVSAVAAALIILDLFCAWYYNPSSYVRDDERATDVVREYGTFTSRATEGFGWMRMDANGYNNAAVPGDDGVFVLMMGSSHAEGLNVQQAENASSRLGALLRDEDISGCVYNIGMSSHALYRNAANLQHAVERFQPTGYVVIETPDVVQYQWNVENAMQDKVSRLKETDIGLPDWLGRRPLLRRLYKQWMNLKNGTQADEDESEHAAMKVTADQLELYRRTLTEWFAQMRETAGKYGAKLIIYYHPHLLLQENGDALPDTNEACLEAFAGACADAGVIFLDMTEAFMENFAQNHILPHGFCNTVPGAGHLNREGQDMIARKLYEIIMEQEARA